MPGSINFLNQSQPYDRENVGRAFRELWSALDRVQSGETLTKVISTAITTAATSSPTTEYRTNSIAVTAVATTITFLSAMSTTDYQVIAYLIDSEGYVTFLGSPSAKTLTGFTYTFTNAGTLVYFAFKTQ